MVRLSSWSSTRRMVAVIPARLSVELPGFTGSREPVSVSVVETRSGWTGQLATGRGRALGPRTDVAVEDRRGNGHGTAHVGVLEHTADAALDGRRRQQQVRLLSGEPERFQVADGVPAGHPVGDPHVQVVLGVVLVDRDPLEGQILRGGALARP